MLNLKNRSIAASAALVATVITLAAATPINAATPVKVAYGDLNLASAQGVQTFNGRVRVAAREVCNHGVSAVDAASCRSRTIAAAQSKVAMTSDAGIQLASR